MAQLKTFIKRIVLMIIIITIIISSCVAPNSYAKLTIKEGEFYYAGTTTGSYVPSDGVFSWLFNALAEIAEFLLTLIPNMIRMSFVGYTALAEKLLTWALESASGVNVAGEDVNATDLTALSDSSNNVTVQAIVYNRVPALDANLFDTNYESVYRKTIKERNADGELVEKEVMFSPTGQQLICEKCKKSVLECCEGTNCYTSDECGCKGCNACQKYAQLQNAEDPIIIQLKNLVAVWYYVIRLLAVAAMCVLLIAIGIKMAISTVASDKAVYKRMLIDWLVGIILIFTMHYIMYFTITLNGILIDTIVTSANSINKVQLARLEESTQDNREVEKSNDDIEIDVYETIRTRAYDPKLTVGLVGMIMYITLVFMAFKYTLIYLKRFLVICVLTLMAPALGVSYALQKALSGKSASLKKWFTEYILNVLIQVVHALIYAIFISSALVFSLQNVSGVLIALILMNFSLKAEKIFRKIFNLDAGNKGLLGETETAGDSDRLKKNFNAAKGMFLGAKPIANALTAPARAVVGGAAKLTTGAALIGGARINAALHNRNNDNYQPGPSSTGESSSTSTSTTSSDGQDVEERNESKDTSTSANTSTVPDTSSRVYEDGRSSRHVTRGQEDRELLRTGEEKLQEKFDKAKKAYEEDPKNFTKLRNLMEANRKLDRFREISARGDGDLTLGRVIAGHGAGLFDPSTYFNITRKKDGSVKYTVKPGAVFGKLKYDGKTGRFVRDKSGTAFNQLSPSNLLGFSENDKKIFKEQVMAPTLKGIGGMASMFLGMGNLVAHPVVGMGMLAGGAGTTASTLKKFKKPHSDSPGRLKVLKLAKNKNQIFPGKRLKFGSFSTPTLAHMRDNVVFEANKELSAQLIAQAKQNKPKFTSKLKNNLIKPTTLVFATGVGIVPAAIGAFGVTAFSSKGKQDPRNNSYKDLNNPYQIGTRKEVMNADKIRLYPSAGSVWDIVDKQHFTQMKEQEVEFYDEANALISQREISDAKVKYDKILKKAEEKVDNTDIEEYNKMLIQIWAARGFKYDPKTGQRTAMVDIEEEEMQPEIKVKQKNSSGTVVEKKVQISKKDIDNVNKKLDEIIANKIKGREIDVQDEKMMDSIMKELSDKLAVEGLIDKNQTADILFKEGKGTLKRKIKAKASHANNIVKATQEVKLNTREYDAVKEAMLEVAKESASEDGTVDLSKLDQDKILAKVQEKLPSSKDTSQPKARGQSTKSAEKGKKKQTLDTTVDTQLTQISEKEKFKSAISTLLSQPKTVEAKGKTTSTTNNGMVINVKSSNPVKSIDSVITAQNDLNVALIRNRILTPEGTLSRQPQKVSERENRDLIKKSVRRQITELVETYSQDTVSVQDPDQNKKKEKVKKAMSRLDKLKQAEEATAGLDTVSKDAVIDSLLVITQMQENIRELNQYGAQTLTAKSKYVKGGRSKTQKAYLEAQIELSDAKITQNKHKKALQQLEDLAALSQSSVPTPQAQTQQGTNQMTQEEKQKQKKDITAKIEQAALAVGVAEQKIASVGPVQDVRTATQDVLKSLQSKRN